MAGFGLTPPVVAPNKNHQRRTPEPLLGPGSSAVQGVCTRPPALSIGAGAVLVSIVDYRLLFLASAAILALASSYLWFGRQLTPAALAESAGPAGPAGPMPLTSADSVMPAVPAEPVGESASTGV